MFDYSCNGPRLTAHRKPTKSEINRGYGATHYKEIPVSLFTVYTVAGKSKFSSFEDASAHASKIYQKSGAIVSIEKHLKQWISCPIDGLRYYR